MGVWPIPQLLLPGREAEVTGIVVVLECSRICKWNILNVHRKAGTKWISFETADWVRVWAASAATAPISGQPGHTGHALFNREGGQWQAGSYWVVCILARDLGDHACD